MGIVRANIELLNLKDKLNAEDGYIQQKDIRKITAKMMVDSDAVMLAINEEIKNQLGLKAREKQSFSLVNGQIVELEVVSGIEVNFKNRWCVTDAIVLHGNTEPLLGAVPMELMDLVVVPFDQTLDVNPKHPNKPQHMLGGIEKA
ncbi:MAG: clan AA aspartic protease [Bacteroidota bacterium]|nr:clan AA aspartic protease [Bacteroidota bacterium]